MTATQHMDDIVIPVIEISEGWPVTEVKDIDDCDDAFAYLTSAIVQIESQIDLANLDLSSRDVEWLIRAKGALKYKKAALQLVQNRRKKIHDVIKRTRQKEYNIKLINFIKSEVPTHTFMEWVRLSGVEDE